MRIPIALAAIIVSLPVLALAQPRWTFCVASSKSGADVWITEVFVAVGNVVLVGRNGHDHRLLRIAAATAQLFAA